jgi:hypothetical protein
MPGFSVAPQSAVNALANQDKSPSNIIALGLIYCLVKPLPTTTSATGATSSTTNTMKTYAVEASWNGFVNPSSRYGTYRQPGSCNVNGNLANLDNVKALIHKAHHRGPNGSHDPISVGYMCQVISNAIITNKAGWPITELQAYILHEWHVPKGVKKLTV